MNLPPDRPKRPRLRPLFLAAVVVLLVLVYLMLEGCAGTTLERVVYHPDGREEVTKFKTDGTWNNAQAMPIKDFPPPPVVVSDLGRVGAPGATAASVGERSVSLGPDLYLNFGQLQHSDIAQVRGQTGVALADRAVVGVLGGMTINARKAIKTGEDTNALKAKEAQYQRDVELQQLRLP